MNKQDKWLNIFIISIIIFNCFFIFTIVKYYHVIDFPNVSCKYMTKEIYYSMVSTSDKLPEIKLFKITYIVEKLFIFLLLGGFLHLVNKKEYLNILGTENILRYVLIGMVINILIYVFIKYNIMYHRPFMMIIYDEVFSLLLLMLIVRLQRVIKNE